MKKMNTAKLMAGAGLVVGVLMIQAVATAAPEGGTIVGSTKFEGRMAKPKLIRVSGDAYCVQNRKDAPLERETYIFNEEKGTLCNVVVYISDGLDGDFEAPEDAVAVEQHGCQYVPHVVSVMAGQTVHFENGDETMHNLNLKAENNPGFNESQPAQNMVKEVVFKKADYDPPMTLKCDVHAWMGAYIAVFDHPFHAVSDDQGEFKIENVPAGTYTLSVWHEFDKFSPVEETIEVTVVEGEETTIDFTYKPPAKK
ncbi:MAG: hypothetical protein D8M59_02195 [Planctomycetes bacterium]|nr:hypothetical protein [Planctomycetota bacterium]NOG54468.1 hypothetical protein [Planctomycetota bacterium]